MATQPGGEIEIKATLASQSRSIQIAAYVLILPAMALYTLFVVWPLVGTLRLSFFEWNGVSESMTYLGLQNYLTLVQDPRFWLVLKNNLLWVVVKLVLTVGPALLLAVGMQNVIWGRAFFRTTFFLPNVLSIAVVGVVWGQIYDPFIGILNGILRLIGLDVLARGWLGDPTTALYALVVANSWQAYGFYMVLYLAGLQNIDGSLYEAAAIDGASKWQQFRGITLPLLKRTTTLVVVLAMINAMKAFDIIWTTTQGGPFFATEVLATWTYRLAFARNEVGLGAALSAILGVIIITATIFTMKLRGEEE